ncbi:unnamed protein product, partial [Thlaspi arvense]
NLSSPRKLISRKRRGPKSSVGGVNDNEKKLLDHIRSKQGMGATRNEMKAGTNIQQTQRVTLAINSLKKKNLIKEVPSKRIKHVMVVESEPCKELTGGDWYINGTLDVTKIKNLKEICVEILETHKHKVVTLDVICLYFERASDTYKLTRDQTKVKKQELLEIRRPATVAASTMIHLGSSDPSCSTSVVGFHCPDDNICIIVLFIHKEILKNLVLDNVIMEVKSNGLSEYSATRIEQVCYKLTGSVEARAGAFASVPSGLVCI